MLSKIPDGGYFVYTNERLKEFRNRKRSSIGTFRARDWPQYEQDFSNSKQSFRERALIKSQNSRYRNPNNHPNVFERQSSGSKFPLKLVSASKESANYSRKKMKMKVLNDDICNNDSPPLDEKKFKYPANQEKISII